MADHYDERGNLLVNPSGSLPSLASPVGAKITTSHSPTNYAGTFENTVDINAALGRNSAGGWIANDGPGILLVGLSADGTTSGLTTDGTTSTVLVLATGEAVDLPAGIDTMKIDADAANTAYRFEVV